jgi:hyperosmotically inducible periplasmic protein
MKTHVYSFMLPVVLFLTLTGTPVQAQTDDRIVSSVKESYVFRTYLKDDNINIDAKDGVVTLTGTVLSEDHKILAQETVSNVSGVKRVENQLQVKGQETVPVLHSDPWIGVKVKAALLFHRNVSALKTQVDVKDGVVTLRGNANSQAQKDLTTEYAKDVEGVKNVKNEMIVVEGSTSGLENTLGNKIDDASIIAQAKMALLAHRSTSAISTKVEAKDGVITVSGKAKNSAEKELVTKLVSDIEGVKNVINNMTVE